MSTAPGERLTGAEAMELLYVLTADVARRAGVRSLAIKGSVLGDQGLRAPRVSADIDVLVHPDDMEAFAAGMAAAGWRRNPETRTAKFLTYHSVDLLNDHWPMGIDAHRYFPGFLAPPDEVFEELWTRRSTLACAGHEVPCTGVTGSVAISALHYLRAPGKPTNRAALDELVGRAETVLDDALRLELADLARRTGAVRTLAPFLDGLGIETQPTHPAEETEYDRWHTATTTHAHLAWWAELRRTPLSKAPSLIWHALMLTPEELRAYHGDRTETTPIWRLRVQRWRRVLRRLPGVLRDELAKRRATR
ncbi:nucleotidyltransferase family protein [Nocardioides sp. Y6]|uniref:Nucleotidyltransferase family protein n=1 Tax=Nocardioides malaquae TaxID=2773426 RepID=A0ABR9RQM4_9ACTN|nr:nucleotidyltransferase family protein [Nocardioides malaquae]MBE7323856.1 nucleotidyltransferase family protein [Nocardioides malaquae]